MKHYPKNRIGPGHIASAIQVVKAMSIKEKEKLADEIYLNQPNMLGSILVLSRFGASMETVGELLNVLFACYESMRASGRSWPPVTEQMQDKGLSRLAGRIMFIEGLSPPDQNSAVKSQVDDHPEQYLFAYVMDALRHLDIAPPKTETDKFVALAALNIVECVSNASDA